MRENAGEAVVALDNRQPPQLVMRHQPQRFIEVGIRLDADHTNRGNVADRDGFEVHVLRHEAGGYVSIGDYPDEAPLLSDRKTADVLVAHHLRCFHDRLRRHGSLPDSAQ